MPAIKYSLLKTCAPKELPNSKGHSTEAGSRAVRSFAILGAKISPMSDDKLASERLEVKKLLEKYGFSIK